MKKSTWKTYIKLEYWIIITEYESKVMKNALSGILETPPLVPKSLEIGVIVITIILIPRLFQLYLPCTNSTCHEKFVRVHVCTCSVIYQCHEDLNFSVTDVCLNIA